MQFTGRPRLGAGLFIHLCLSTHFMTMFDQWGNPLYRL